MDLTLFLTVFHLWKYCYGFNAPTIFHFSCHYFQIMGKRRNSSFQKRRNKKRKQLKKLKFNNENKAKVEDDSTPVETVKIKNSDTDTESSEIVSEFSNSERSGSSAKDNKGSSDTELAENALQEKERLCDPLYRSYKQWISLRQELQRHQAYPCVSKPL